MDKILHQLFIGFFGIGYVLVFVMLGGQYTAVKAQETHLLVSNTSPDSVLRFDTESGTFLGTFIPPDITALNDPTVLVFGPDQKLYVANAGLNSVLRYDGHSGAFLDVFVRPGSGGLSRPTHLTFGPDENLYVSSSDNAILRYVGQNGAFIDAFVPTIDGQAASGDIAFGPDEHLYVLTEKGIERYNGHTGDFLERVVTFSYDSSLSESYSQMAMGPDGSLYVSYYALPQLS